MDFSNQYQFAGTQPAAGYNPFMSVAPLTPSRSQSDDYNGSSPSAFGQQHSNSFANGNPSFSHASVAMTGADLGSQNKSESDEAGNGRAGSEEENMTPAQSKRKAQNRAAQRAFRERKEKHVKDLEAKLADLEAAQQQASAENERLKRDLQKVSTENEILKATTTTGGRNHLQSSSSPSRSSPDPCATTRPSSPRASCRATRTSSSPTGSSSRPTARACTPREPRGTSSYPTSSSSAAWWI
uniref:BZIP domain-containing protein n=1 Tax=Bionectria ochroleuca TaxID=29856 RepID=A0A8H7NJR0_BIOOC